jgi:glycerol dehydrogenase
MVNIGEYLTDLGDNAFIIISEGGIKRSSRMIESSLKNSGIRFTFEIFGGECVMTEIRRLCSCSDNFNANVIVGIGGGKILDTAKAVAHDRKLPLAIVPTVASTDAPCSAMSIIYKENGEFDRYLYLSESPNLVLVDLNTILNAGTRLLVAGMGDALATYYEARAVQRSGKNNQLVGKPTVAAWSLAEKARDILLHDGLNAKIAADIHVCTPAFENIVEVNTYLSGVGFESGGLAAAHAIQKGLTLVPDLHSVYHGFKVAFCVLVQLVMENAPLSEIDELIRFYHSVGLPSTFAELGLKNANDETIALIAENSIKAGMTIHNMPFEITKEKVFAAIKAADGIGRYYKGQ